MSVYNMTLSTTEPTNNVGVINVRQGDKESQTFVAEMIENNISKDDINGYSVFLNSMFEGNIIARDLADFDYGTGVATYTLKESFYQRVGKVSAYFSFEKDGVSDSTANFEYTVIPGACQNIRQGNYIYELEELFKISEDIIKNKDFTILINMIKDVDRKVAEVQTQFDESIRLINIELNKKANKTQAQMIKSVADDGSPIYNFALFNAEIDLLEGIKRIGIKKGSFFISLSNKAKGAPIHYTVGTVHIILDDIGNEQGVYIGASLTTGDSLIGNFHQGKFVNWRRITSTVS